MFKSILNSSINTFNEFNAFTARVTNMAAIHRAVVDIVENHHLAKHPHKKLKNKSKGKSIFNEKKVEIRIKQFLLLK